MYRSTRILVLLLAAALFTAPSLSAQQENDDRPVIEKQIDTSRISSPLINPATDSRGRLTETDRKIGIARTLMRQRNHNAAATLLEVILEDEPNNGVVLNLLLNCYRELNHTIKAEALLTRLLETQPNSYHYRVSLAEVLASQDKIDAAIEQYDRAAALMEDWDDPRIRSLIQSQLKHGVVDHALAYIDTARAETGDSTLFAVETGQLLERLGEYRKAVREYFPVLAEDTSRAAADAEKRLFAMLEFVESSEETEDALLHISEGKPNARALRLLSTHYIRNEQFDKAFRFTLQQDSLDNSGGHPLLYYIRQCSERDKYQQAIRMSERVLARYDDRSPVMIDVLFHYADALAQMGRFDSAIVRYEQIVNMQAPENDRAEALYRIGMVHADYLNDCQRGLEYFDSVVTNHQRGIGYLYSRMQIPKCYIRLGELGQARTAYQQLSQSRLSPDWTEEIAYQQALIWFYQKQFDSAQTALQKLMVDYPRGFFVNDALRLIMNVKQAGDDEAVLYDYSDAVYFTARRMPDSARARYRQLAESPDAALGDIALLRLARMDLVEADSSGAMATIDTLLVRYPESYYYAFGLKAKADLLMSREGQREDAAILYRRLLEEFPNYPFASDVRESLRRYEQERVG